MYLDIVGMIGCLVKDLVLLGLGSRRSLRDLILMLVSCHSDSSTTHILRRKRKEI